MTFHIVFTTDHALNSLFRQNKRVLYDLLFKTVSEVLQAKAKEALGCELGITAVLHSWGQQLEEHIHIHCIVTGGGLRLDGQRWILRNCLSSRSWDTGLFSSTKKSRRICYLRQPKNTDW